MITLIIISILLSISNIIIFGYFYFKQNKKLNNKIKCDDMVYDQMIAVMETTTTLTNDMQTKEYLAKKLEELFYEIQIEGVINDSLNKHDKDVVEKILTNSKLMFKFVNIKDRKDQKLSYISNKDFKELVVAIIKDEQKLEKIKDKIVDGA